MKICFFTGTRAEYGLLKPLISGCLNDNYFKVSTIVTGTHLSPSHGYTIDEIEADGIPVTKRIEIILSSNTANGVCKSSALGLLSFSEALTEINPDLVVILGDRSEALMMGIACLFHSIPVGHISGGELTYGAYDDSIRHSLSKISHIHFSATEEYRKRIVSLGEHPNYVHNVGALSVENVKTLNYLSRSELSERLNHNLKSKVFLVTFHPETNGNEDQLKHITNLLVALEQFIETNISIIFTKSNSDKGGEVINQEIERFVNRYSENCVLKDSLGSFLYLNIMNISDLVIGNSSSGLTEAPILSKITINIGSRQEGRTLCNTVLCCSNDSSNIVTTINKGIKIATKSKVMHPFGDGKTSFRIQQILKNTKLPFPKKRFYE